MLAAGSIHAGGHMRIHNFVVLIALLVGGLGPVDAARIPSRPHPTEILGLPSGDWPLVLKTKTGYQTYLIPSQLAAIRRLPEPDRSEALAFVRSHQANLRRLKLSSEVFHLRSGKGDLRSVPEYQQDMSEAIMAVDAELAASANPILPHEPVLLALPGYTKILLLTPPSALAKVRSRLRDLGIAGRVRVIDSGAPPVRNPDGTTRWIRDAVHVVHADRRTLVAIPLAHKQFDDLAHNDLAYVGRIGDRRHEVLQIPVYFRGGNLARIDHDKRILLIGADEIQMNMKWFIESFGFRPPATAVQEILKTATGVDAVVVLPNSRNFYHLDMYLTPLGPGVVGLLAPLDHERLSAVDRKVLLESAAALARLGLRTVPIPTLVDWIEKFQSPTNSVSFTERGTSRRRALVPQFPEHSVPAALASVNRRVLAAYRQAGIDPIAVEDRFHTRWGNTHCALVALR